MRIKEILQTIEQLAPLPLQEEYDNSGLQVGDPNRDVIGVLLCIDVTENVIDEAVSLGCNLIIAHHPIAFRPFKSLTGKTYVERCIIQAIKQDIVIYAAHTNLDNAQGGVNYKLAEMLELQQVKILQPRRGALLKFVTTVPIQHADSVRNALFNAGAGIKESISHTVSMLDRYGSHKLQQGAPSRLQDLHLLQLQHLRQLVVDTPLCIVEVGVSGINHDILLDGLYDASFHISLPGERLKRSKSNGVMCYDEVAAQGDRFVDHILGDIDA